MIGFANFIGYNSNRAEGDTYVKGFTDVLYATKLESGQTMEDYVVEHEAELRALFCRQDFRIERPGLECLSNILDGLTLGVTALIRSVTGYNMVTKEVLSEADKCMSGVQGVIILGGSIFMLATAGVSGASLVYVLVSNSAEVVATETTQLICNELGLPQGVTMVVTMLAGIMTEAGMAAVLLQMQEKGAVELAEGALEATQKVDDVTDVKVNLLDDVNETVCSGDKLHDYFVEKYGIENVQRTSFSGGG